jgi:hypothetical protein
MPRRTNFDEIQVDHDVAGHGYLWSDGGVFADQTGLTDFNDQRIWDTAAGRVTGVGQDSLVVHTYDLVFGEAVDSVTETDAAEDNKYPIACFFIANTGASTLCSAEVVGDDVIVRLDAVPGVGESATVRLVMLRE